MSNEYVPDGEVVDDGSETPIEVSGETNTVDGHEIESEDPSTVESGSVGEAVPAQEAAQEEPSEPTVEQQLAERTEDLKRLQAEYVNYKRRVDRDRAQARTSGIEAVMVDLLPTLDAIALARQAEELTGGPRLIADELEKVAAKYGVESYGTKGEPFDPQVHDALMSVPGEEGQTEALAAEILQQGWKVGGRIVRHARVCVSEPTA